MSNKEFEGDAGAPLPDFSGARNISLTTVAPALGVRQQGQSQPDYLDFDQKGRGVVVTMFANSGMCYLLGIGGGGLYGLQRGITSTPSTKFKVKVNSVLNNAGGEQAGGVCRYVFDVRRTGRQPGNRSVYRIRVVGATPRRYADGYLLLCPYRIEGGDTRWCHRDGSRWCYLCRIHGLWKTRGKCRGPVVLNPRHDVTRRTHRQKMHK